MIKKRKRELNTVARPSGRMKAVSGWFILMGFLITARLFFLQVIEYPLYDALASGQHEVLRQLLPERGEIFAETEDGLYPLAINRDTYIVYAVPQEIDNVTTTVDVILPWIQEIIARDIPEEENVEPVELIAEDEDSVESTEMSDEKNKDVQDDIEEEEVVDPEYASLFNRLNKADDPYEPLMRGVDKKDIAVLEQKNLKGIYWIGVPSRYYPDKKIGSHSLGFFSNLSDVRKGRYGLEGYWDEILSGKQGILRSEKDAGGSQISIAPRTLQQAHDGSDLVLTIDPSIQYMACTKLEEYIEKYDAEGGAVVIMQPSTGALIAMCGSPAFDPNKYNKVEDIQVYSNPVLSYAYEPGSIMKPITMAAGLDTGSIMPDSTYEDTGEYKISGFTIRNSDLKAYQEQTMTEVLEKSLNTGVIYVAEQVGQKLFRKYFEAFGFGKSTGVRLSGEVNGNISSLDKKGFVYTATASFGQGITVTPIQMVTAFSAIANGGILYKPYIVKEVQHYDGKIEKTEPIKIRQVISPEASAMLSGMLVSVVKNGHGTKAGVKGYLVAGKTGTAQVAGDNGKYGDKTIHSFIGFAPVDKPEFVMLVKLDAPTAVRFSSDSAAPLFGEIADFILKYYHIPPTEL